MAKFIVIFKKTASTEEINSQADEVNASGGSVTQKFNSVALKGFAAEIPETYLRTLESSLQQPDSQIDFIEPDSEVKVQAQ